MQTLALISLYTPVVIIIVAVAAVLFSFFWVFLPPPRWLSSAMGRRLDSGSGAGARGSDNADHSPPVKN